jgi:hypothetical protein
MWLRDYWPVLTVLMLLSTVLVATAVACDREAAS